MLSTFDTFKNLQVEGARELTEGDLAALHKVLCGILDDIASVCREEKISWHLGGGSALGAVRHQGFIPWDDDLDVNMPRREWERFLLAFLLRFGAKYVVYYPGNPAEYPLAFPRIRLRTTSYVTREDLLPPHLVTGAFIDVFLLENVPDNFILRHFHAFFSNLFGFLYSCRKAFHERRQLASWGLGGGVFAIKKTIGFCVSFASLGLWTRLWNKWNGIVKNNSTRYVTFPVGRKHYWGEIALRSDMEPEREGRFEGRAVPLPCGIDAYMKRLYGPDYMTPPPEAKREKHIVFGFDMGDSTPNA